MIMPMLSRKTFATDSLKFNFLKDLLFFFLIVSVPHSTTSKTINNIFKYRVQQFQEAEFPLACSSERFLIPSKMQQSVLIHIRLISICSFTRYS